MRWGESACSKSSLATFRKLNFDFNLASSGMKKTGNILITRNRTDSAELVEFLEQQGLTCFCEPLFTVKKHRIPKILSPISAAIITSSNACFALAESGLVKNLPIFCVGKITAKKLSEFGFTNLRISAPENADSLLELVKSQCRKNDVIAYFHGSIITLDFKNELESQGFRVEKIPAYETREVKKFSVELKKFLAKNSCDYVLIFSSNSAEIFLRLLKSDNPLASLTRLKLVCLSEKIRQKISSNAEINFAEVITFNDLPILRKFYERSQ